MHFKVLTDHKECSMLWDRFSPKKVLWDLWGFRYCFHNKDTQLHFIVGYEDGKESGLLPLFFDVKYHTYYYFGDVFVEQNKFFLKDKSKIGAFLEQCPADTEIDYIDSSEKKYYDFEESENRYFLNLAGFSGNIENYLNTFNKKHRKNLRYDLKKLLEMKIHIEANSDGCFERFVDLNIKRFGTESDYLDLEFKESVKSMISLAKEKKMLDMISLSLNGKKEAVGIGMVYNKVYYVIGFARNPDIGNIGKLLIYEEIKSALAKGCEFVDFLSTDTGWKSLWNLQSEKMYLFEK